MTDEWTDWLLFFYTQEIILFLLNINSVLSGKNSLMTNLQLQIICCLDFLKTSFLSVEASKVDRV